MLLADMAVSLQNGFRGNVPLRVWKCQMKRLFVTYKCRRVMS